MEFTLKLNHRDRSAKKVQIMKKMIAQISLKDIVDSELSFYGHFREKVLCVDAVHETEEGTSQPYTWYIPESKVDTMFIFPGNKLEVENLDETAIVTAVGHPYWKTKSQHEDEVHPYCAVLGVLTNNAEETLI